MKRMSPGASCFERGKGEMTVQYKMSSARYAGASHTLRHSPCQDWVVTRRGKEIVSVVLADGAGSKANSQIGAERVAAGVTRLLQRDFQTLWNMSRRERGIFLLESCREFLEQEPFPLDELASTLQFFAGDRSGRYLSGNLGDGLQIMVEPNRLSVFSPQENGDYKNETFFVTDSDAVDHLRLGEGELPPRGALLLMSDGMAESLYQCETGIPAPACETMAHWLEEGEEKVISQALEENMRQHFSKRSGDDLSLAIITWIS